MKYKIQHEWDLLHSTPGYSMDAAAGLLARLERDGWTIEDASWKGVGYGSLIETGIKVEQDGCSFAIMCSYGDILMMRMTCNKTKYRQLFEQLQQHVAAGA